jgi:hypothetical protein
MGYRGTILFPGHHTGNERGHLVSNLVSTHNLDTSAGITQVLLNKTAIHGFLKHKDNCFSNASITLNQRTIFKLSRKFSSVELRTNK